jgi:hypothetical protein
LARAHTGASCACPLRRVATCNDSRMRATPIPVPSPEPIDVQMLHINESMANATWVAGIATALTLILAIATSLWALKKQREADQRQIAADDRQRAADERQIAADERQRAADERAKAAEQRSQAEKITVWIEAASGTPSAVISNASHAPVWQVFVTEGRSNRGPGSAAVFRGEGKSTGIADLPPGRWSVPLPPKFEGGEMHAVAALAVTFRDASGRFWQRDATGVLYEIDHEPVVDLEVGNPFGDWVRPRRIE